jgi:hypothetical protein
METIKGIFKNNVIAVGVLVTFAWLGSAFILAQGITGVNKKDAISVTGTAEKIVKSDSGKLTFAIVEEAEPERYVTVSKKISEQAKKTAEYLVKQGIESNNITILPLTSSAICQSQNQVLYDGRGTQRCAGEFHYSLSQQIIVDSNDVDLIQGLSLGLANDLSEQKIFAQINSVEYFYTKLSDLRIELLQLAAQNAKERAVAIAGSTGGRIGVVRDASQGVFQVTGKNSIEVSDYGSYDTSAVEKKVTALVRASFEVR